MKVKVSEATNTQLNWMVATAIGRAPKKDMNVFGGVWRGWWLSKGGEYERMPDYCGVWSQGGPIIEREKIDISFFSLGALAETLVDDKWVSCMGSTPLIAAMRCYVVSKLGDEVEVPEELCQS